jgi:ATP-dependent protease ClpP protease subunit
MNKKPISMAGAADHDVDDPANLFESLFKKDLEDIKVDGNKIFFHKEISRETVLSLICTLNQTAKKLKSASDSIGLTEYQPIYLFINSGGGDLFAGMSAHDHIKNMDYPVYTVIDGMVASAGTFVSMAGHRRFMMPSAWVLIHQIKTWFDGYYTFEETKEDLANTSRFMKNLTKMYLENTNLTKKKLDTFFKRDIYMDADEALRLGIVDELYFNFGSQKRQKTN